jgi:hypothetical protein
MPASFALALVLSPTLSEDVLREVQAVHWRAEGRQEAERDIAVGQMKFQIYGYMAGFSERDKAFTRLMRDRFDVSVEAVAQCIVTDEIVEHAKGYNGRIEEEVNSKFGPGALDRTWDDSATWYQLPLGRLGLRVLLVLGAGVLFLRLRRRLRKNQALAQA